MSPCETNICEGGPVSPVTIRPAEKAIVIGNSAGVAYAERERIAGAVGEACDRHALGIDGDARERLLQRCIDAADVLAESRRAAAGDCTDRIPCAAGAIGRKEDDSAPVGLVAKATDHVAAPLSAAVQQHQERCSLTGREAGGM